MIPIHQAAPSFALPSLNGRLVHLEEARGRLLILNFWSAECPWVERADREVKKYLLEWGESVQLWSVSSNSNEPVDLLNRTSIDRGLPLLLLDANHLVADLYHAMITPQYFVIDAGGILRYQGALDDVNLRQREPEHFYLRQAVEALRSGGLPDPAETLAYGCSIVRWS